MSLRLKMTFLFCSILALTMLIFGTIVYVRMEHDLNAEVQRAITDIAEELVRSTKLLENFPVPSRQLDLPEVDFFANPVTYIQILDRDGIIIAQSGNMGGQIKCLGGEKPQEIDFSNSFYEMLSIGSQKLCVYNRPLLVDDEVVGVLRIARTLDSVAETLISLRLLLFIGVGLALCFAGALGWLLASSTLKPISQITETAQAIHQAQDLKRRINYTGPKDEVGYLAETFNQMLERIYKAYKDLEEAEASQRRFVSDASHELRTPITTIRGNAELLKRMGDSNPEARSEALADIICEGERMTRLVTNLLALARADSGFKFDLVNVDLEALLLETSRQAAVLAQNVHFTVKDISCIRGVFVKANADYLKQLFLILLQNAFQYAGDGENVWIEGRLVEGWAEVSVCDSGSGIDESDLPYVFQRFYRASKSRQSEGTGLGLSIAKWIVEQHAGSIHVESEKGKKGSVFSVRLPLSA